MIFFFVGLVAAKPLFTKSIRVDSDPPPDCNGLKCSLGTQFCTICCNGQGSKHGKCVPKGTFYVCQCQ